MKTIILRTVIGVLFFIGSHHNATAFNNQGANNPEKELLEKDNTTKIQVALLLDTSSSMDGLIEQAKSRLWNIVNTLTTLKYNGKAPQIEIALYEYGNDGISEKNYIRKVAPLTQDLDLISEKLFSLKTNGGLEYCGAVISYATEQLEWNKNKSSMKLIYIAGNEPFNQGTIHYKEAISEARKNNIYINTIYCGNAREGIETEWKNGADLGDGKFFNIDSNRKIRYIETPYDVKIADCNDRLNKTYISYGSKGAEYKNNQAVQDRNAKEISPANYTERTVSKAKTAVYSNSQWDLIDKYEENKNIAKELKKEDLPAELKDKSASEIESVLAEKTKERKNIQQEIATLSVKRQNYIEEEMKKSGNSEDDLGNAIESSIMEIALKNGYKKD